MKKISYVFLATLWVMFFLVVRPGVAQMSFVVSPIRVEHQVATGASETNVIEVRNEGKNPARVKVYAEDWQMDRKGDVTYARAGKGPNSCATWLQLNPTDFRVNPGQVRQIRYTLTVPPGSRAGGYHAAIVFEGMPVTAGGPGAARKVAVHGRIGVVLYETVGKPDIKAKFEAFQVQAARGKLNFKLTVANKGAGNFRIKKSWITLKNSKGEVAGKVEIPDIPLLPGGVRDLEFSKELALPKGTYLAEAVLDVGRRDLLGRRQSFTIGH